MDLVTKSTFNADMTVDLWKISEAKSQVDYKADVRVKGRLAILGVLADAAKSKLDLDPLGGEEVQKMVSGMFKLPPALVSRLREILK